MAMLPRELAAVALVGLVVLSGPGHAQAQTDLDRLLTDVWKNQQELGRLIAEVGQLYGQGRNAEALPVAERAVAVAREYYGETRAEFASALSWLATIHLAQGRFDEAEQLFRRSLSIYEGAQGPEHFNVAATLNNLASVYRAQGRTGPDAESFLKRSVLISEKALGPDHPNLGTSL